ncbi:hypothetical protein D2Q93_14795 [Alicyclobacillaceae bacterium I2511]|nr:hypothetical protein D2Q93_14795 [Alicyclobacillaceae bacterium I2511]
MSFTLKGQVSDLQADYRDPLKQVIEVTDRDNIARHTVTIPAVSDLIMGDQVSVEIFRIRAFGKMLVIDGKAVKLPAVAASK